MNGSVVNERLARLGRRSEELSLSYRRQFVGEVVEVLVERDESRAAAGDADRGQRHGRCERYFDVHFDAPGARPGDFAGAGRTGDAGPDTRHVSLGRAAGGGWGVIAVVQRVTEARVAVEGRVVGRIAGGLVALVAVHGADTRDDVAWMAGKLVGMRIFRRGDKHFDADVKQAGGAVLLVSNFTVAAATRQGRRPSFDAAAPPEKGRELFDALVEAVRGQGHRGGDGRLRRRHGRSAWSTTGR